MNKEGFDKAILHLNFANKRKLIALCVVCVTFIITILTFVIGYTVREKNWLNTITQMQTEVTNESNAGL